MRTKRRSGVVRAAGAALIVLAVLAGAVGVYRSDLFAVQRVVVEGERELSSQEVVGLAALPPDSTLLRFPRDEMVRRLSGHAWIAGAHIGRRFPGTLVVHIEER
ncbi:MAG TPA: FtsQ-type POTRA domain-containing protein [Coriobacteriia bacterium]|nr:FtsQ-type POTRA domain-containing protein [Coriobacteriia bacterium]